MHLPKLLEDINKAVGLSKADKEYIKRMQEKWNPESTETLRATAEANKQYLITALDEVRKIHMKMIVIEDMIKVRETLKK